MIGFVGIFLVFFVEFFYVVLIDGNNDCVENMRVIIY